MNALAHQMTSKTGKGYARLVDHFQLGHIGSILKTAAFQMKALKQGNIPLRSKKPMLMPQPLIACML